ncbi:uncharacterized protein LOC143254189 isoform X2 [Tachypleus tridentatus]|uniref:uncharacterized protein LOC143254189 isoform X2 n=1 Tax=Tachypleus tridentatus TaxID=6853 RepID=UPI003FD00F10
MKSVVFFLLLTITVYTVGSYARNEITENIHNCYGGCGDIRSAVDIDRNKSGLINKPGFVIGSGNGKYKKNMFGRDTSLDLGLNSDLNLRGCLKRGTQTARKTRIVLRRGSEERGSRREIGRETRIVLRKGSGERGSRREIGRETRIVLRRGSGERGSIREIGRETRIVLRSGSGERGSIREIGRGTRLGSELTRNESFYLDE